MAILSSILKEKKSRVLVVDDLPDNSFLIQAILIDEGYDIVVEDNGQAAIARIEEQPPDLLILDVMMPSMDGYEVTRTIRSNPDLPLFPILLITAHDTPSAVEGLDMGADDFIRKPVEVAELLARVRSLLRLKHTMDERDRIASQRADFVSRLTHDLRTPLVATDRMLELILEGHFGTYAHELQEVFATMAASNQNLLALVNNLLQLYRFEAGLYPLEFTSVSIQELVQEVILELTHLSDAKGITLKAEFPDTSIMIDGDRLELRRLLTNLIGNAIKFTEEGGVLLRISAPSAAESSPESSPESSSESSPESSRQMVTIQVIDTGVGISTTVQNSLFDRFSAGTHKYSGSGLGLHVAKYILEAHQGTIEVDSILGEGSTFVIELPQHQTPQPSLKRSLLL